MTTKEQAKTPTLRVGGVPEHFNLPWHQGIDGGDFEQNGVKVSWEDCPKGTGQMRSKLKDDELDVAVILTEGVTQAIAKGEIDARIAQVYVQSPLYWGIHVAADNTNIQSLKDLEGKKVGVSRIGSGSDLMASVCAFENESKLPETEEKIILGNLDGLTEGIQEGKADYFMWEHFTTRHRVDSGELRRVTDFPTPWAPFVIAVSEKALREKPEAVERMLEVINAKTQAMNERVNKALEASKKGDESLLDQLAEEFKAKYPKYSAQDIKDWLQFTKCQWSQAQVPAQTLDKVQAILVETKQLDAKQQKSSTDLTRTFEASRNNNLFTSASLARGHRPLDQQRRATAIRQTQKSQATRKPSRSI